MTLKLLILGGTSEANALSGRLADDAGFAATLSLAGRTGTPRLPNIPVRIGGFGGARGLAEFLGENEIDVVVDATHPFAEQISANALAATQATHTALIVLERPAWRPVPGDRWTMVSGLAEAATALPDLPSRIFLTVGRQSLGPFAAKPQHAYLIRVIDPPEIPKELTQTEIITGRGPFELDAEIALLRGHGIRYLVTKNSGGEAASAKLVAARALGVPIIMVERPAGPAQTAVTSVDSVLSLLARHHASLANRSE